MGFLLRLLGLFLLLVALLTGGCSLAFTYLLLTDPAGSSILPFWLIGLVIGAVCLWAGLALFRHGRGESPATPNPGDP